MNALQRRQIAKGNIADRVAKAALHESRHSRAGAARKLRQSRFVSASGAAKPLMSYPDKLWSAE